MGSNENIAQLHHTETHGRAGGVCSIQTALELLPLHLVECRSHSLYNWINLPSKSSAITPPAGLGMRSSETKAHQKGRRNNAHWPGLKKKVLPLQHEPR